MEQARNIFGVDSEEMAGLVGDDCQRHSKVEIGASELDLGTMKRHGGSEGDSVSAAVVGDDFGGGLCDGVILLVGSAALMVGFQLSSVSVSDLVGVKL